MYSGLSRNCAIHTGTVPQTGHDLFHQTASNYSSTNPIVLTDSTAAAHARSEVYTEFMQGTELEKRYETTVRSKRQDTSPHHTAQRSSDSN
jgi:hypothetical protein